MRRACDHRPVRKPTAKKAWPNQVAVLWGFAEATVFFVVPDVWFSILARKELRPGLVACVYGLAGALTGGGLLYLLGQNYGPAVLEVMLRVPAVTADQAQAVANEMQEQGIGGLLLAPLTGTPYKLYAAQASATGISLSSFLLVSVPARLARFVGVTLLTHCAIRIIGRWWPNVANLRWLLFGWAVFYAWYWFL